MTLVGVRVLCITRFFGDCFEVVVRSCLRSHNLMVNLSFQYSGETVQASLEAATGAGVFAVGCGRVDMLMAGSGD
jgi:hypothetical protein